MRELDSINTLSAISMSYTINKWFATKTPSPSDPLTARLLTVLRLCPYQWYHLINQAFSSVIAVTGQSFQQNLIHLYFQSPGFNSSKMIYHKPSNVISICYTTLLLETSHMRLLDTNIFLLCVQLYVKIHAFGRSGTHIQIYRQI